MARHGSGGRGGGGAGTIVVVKFSVVTAKLLSSSVVSLYTVCPELHDAARNVLSMPLLGVS